MKLINVYIFFTILLLYIVIVESYCNIDLKYYIYDTKIIGPTILLIGGTHGNEPAGTITINILKKKLDEKTLKLKRGKIILIPEVNHCALKLNIRFIPMIGDMNRKYPYKNNQKISNKIIKKIIELTDNADFVIDFHEGWGYNKIDKKSMGSSITPTGTLESSLIAHNCIRYLNKDINDQHKKFVILTSNVSNQNQDSNQDSNQDYISYNKSIDIKGTLRYYMNMKNKNYILVETTGQNKIQPIDTRIEQNKKIIRTVFDYYKL